MRESDHDEREDRQTNWVLTIGYAIAFAIIGVKCHRAHRAEDKPSPETSIERTIEAEPVAASSPEEPPQESIDDVVKAAEKPAEPEPVRFINPNPMISRMIRDYRENNDPEPLRKAAKALEDRTPFTNYSEEAFRLYDALGNKEAMQRVARRNYIEHSEHLLEEIEKMVRRAGLEITPELHNERGDYLFKKGRYGEALKAYEKAGNKEGTKKAALKLEGSKWYRHKVLEAYLKSGNKAYASGLAETWFIEDGETKFLEKLGTPVTQEMWNKRGDHQMSLWAKQRSYGFDCHSIQHLRYAFNSYQKARNEAELDKITKIYQRELLRKQVEKVRSEKRWHFRRTGN